MEFIFGLLFIFAFIYFLNEKGLRRRAYLKAISESGILVIDDMNGSQFEDYLFTLFSRMGYKVNKTRATGDFGADIILYKDENRIVVQAKRYAKKVGVKAVQEVHASLGYYGATEAWVVTNNNFTDSAIKLAKINSIRLIDREDLMNFILVSK